MQKYYPPKHRAQLLFDHYAKMDNLDPNADKESKAVKDIQNEVALRIFYGYGEEEYNAALEYFWDIGAIVVSK